MEQKMSKKKQKSKLRKVRNWLAVMAHFRKSGAIKNKKKELAKKLSRKKVDKEYE